MVKQYFIVTFLVQTRKKTISHVSLWPCVPPTNSKEKVKVIIDALLPFCFPFAHSVLSPCSDQKWGCTKILTFKAPLGFWSVVSPISHYLSPSFSPPQPPAGWEWRGQSQRARPLALQLPVISPWGHQVNRLPPTPLLSNKWPEHGSRGEGGRIIMDAAPCVYITPSLSLAVELIHIHKRWKHWSLIQSFEYCIQPLPFPWVRVKLIVNWQIPVYTN